jgi:hypothetical protein
MDDDDDLSNITKLAHPQQKQKKNKKPNTLEIKKREKRN